MSRYELLCATLLEYHQIPDPSNGESQAVAQG
jgi:hypothetical protein